MKKMTDDETIQMFHDMLICEAENGILRWKISPRYKINIGDIAGWTEKWSGYAKVRMSGNDYPVHRVIYAMVYGFLPKVTDHIDRDKTNNSINNLRSVSYSENTINSSKKRGTISKYRGVTVAIGRKHEIKWRAAVRKNGITIALGCFVSEEEAAWAYDNGAKRFHGEFAVTNF